LRNGRFEDVSAVGGPGITAAVPARGCAFGDYDNDGDVDVVVNCVNTLPQLLRCDLNGQRHWIKVKLIGTKSNRTGIGGRVQVTARVQGDKPMVLIDEVRSGGSYFSQSDLRLHFGLDQAKTVDVLEVHWPSGQVDTFRDLPPDRLYVVEEGAKEPGAFVLPAMKKV
jgi:hypothetical protein